MGMDAKVDNELIGRRKQKRGGVSLRDELDRRLRWFDGADPCPISISLPAQGLIDTDGKIGALRASDIATNTPIIATNAPNIAENTPLLATNTPNSATNTPNIDANAPIIATYAPIFAANTPNIAIDRPQRTERACQISCRAG